MISSCETYAAQNKLTPLSIAVVDESGTLVAFTRQKGASPVTAEVALAKAKSAARVGAPTAVLADAAAENQAARDTYSLMQLVAMPGGWPLADGDGTIRGGVGVRRTPQGRLRCANSDVEGVDDHQVRCGERSLRSRYPSILLILSNSPCSLQTYKPAYPLY